MTCNATAHLVAKLRACMKDPKLCSKQLSAYIIPSDDAHQVSKSLSLLNRPKLDLFLIK